MSFALRDGLRQRGHDARLFATSAGLHGEPSSADYQCFGTTSPFRTLLQTANPMAARKLGRVIADFRPDVVSARIFLTQLSPLILPLLRKVPSVYQVVWYRPICPIGTKLLPDGSVCRVPAGVVCYREGCLPLRDWAPLMAQLRMWRRWRDAFDMIVANSHATRRRLMDEGIEPVEVVWNGVPVRPRRRALTAAPSVLFTGRLVREKGLGVLVRAFGRLAPELPTAQLVVVGDGPEGRDLRSLIGGLGLEGRVTMTGWLTREEIERRFDGAWVHAVPSLWEEPFGVVAAEAMMRGTAVVASDAGGLPEVVRHEQTGVLVPPGDADQLATAIRRLLTNRRLAETLGETGREVALGHFSESSYVNGHLRLYERLLESRGADAVSPRGSKAVNLGADAS